MSEEKGNGTKRDESREPIEDIEKTVEDLKKKIMEISSDEKEEDEESEASIPQFAETKKKIAEIRDNTVKSVNKSIEEAKKAAAEKNSQEDLKKTLAYIRENARKVVEAAQDKMDELKKDPKVQQNVQGAKDAAADALSKASDAMKQAAEGTKSYLDTKLSDDQKAQLKDAGGKVSVALNDTKEHVSKAVEGFMNNPQVQEFGRKSADAAQKGAEALRGLFDHKNEGDDK
ncbi:MAG: hypothetical protein SOI44_02640 [Lactimicrobium sp.]|jgi:chromosome segregation ATPase|uniref:hypothetical protein n=1 Tax=Lactimicrobium sp. TaxID=2563780 RepID=UPI002F359FB8